MAITASEITTSNTLEQLRTEFNSLVTDVTGLESGTLAHTEINTTTISATTFNLNEDGTFVFEGATSDAYETTLSAADPTADRTITLPDATGTVVLTGGVITLTDTTEASATGTAALIVAGGIGVAKDMWIGDDIVMDSDSSVIKFGDDQDVTLTHTDGTGLTLNSTSKLTFGDAASFVQQSSDGVLKIDGEATIDMNASTAVTVSNDLKLDSDAAVLGFGTDNDVTLTHVADTGILLNSTMAIQFNDSSQYINAPSNAILDITATDEIELNATLADVNANLDVSGTYQGGGTMTTGGNIVIPDAGTIGSASSTSAITVASTGIVTFVDDILIKDDGTIGSSSAATAIAISSAGVVALAATTEASAIGTAALTVAGGIGVTKDMWIGDDIVMDSDSAVIKLGADQDVTITHVADTGLNIKQVTDADDKALILKLQTGETDIALNDYIGRIQFQAPDEGAGTDAIAVCAEISALSEGDFAADNNATKLVFATGASETATSKMTISSAGIVALSATTEASATTTAALTVAGGIGVAKDMWIGDDIVMDSDSAVLKFGADQDVTLTHVADTGLILSAGAQPTTLTLSSTLASAAVGPKLYLTRASGSPADDDICGDIIFTADNDAAEDTTIVQMYSTFLDASNGSEDASLIIQTVENGSYVASCQFKGSGIQVPDGGNVGSTTTPTAIDILGTGEIGFSDGTISASTSFQTYIYDNTTGRVGLRIVLDNASTAQQALYASTDGTNFCGWFHRSDTSTGNPTIYSNNAAAGPAFQGASAGHTCYTTTSSAPHAALYGIASNTSHYGLIGYSTHGVYGTSVYCVGALTKGSGSFRIPHGLREDYDLCHSFIEGPQCDLIYRGRVTLVDGQASIDIDSHYGMTQGTFEWLTKADDVQTFTTNETGWDAVKSSFSGDTITIVCQNSSSTDTISWMVVAERGDPNIIESTITDAEGNLLIERESEPEVDRTVPPHEAS